MIIFRSSVAVMIALAVAGCSKKLSDEDLICDPSPGLIGVPLVGPPATTFDQEGEVFSCIHKWAYRLGKAPGSNSEIAKATIGKCRGGIENFMNLKIKEGETNKQPFTAEAGQAWMERFEESALTRVVQGRAGACSIRGEGQK